MPVSLTDGAWKPVLVALVISIALSDLRRRRVSNNLSLSVLALGLAAWLQVGGTWGVMQWFFGLVLGGAVLLVPYAAGMLGAADVKVFAAYAAVAGSSRLPVLFGASLLAAGALSLGYLVAWYGASPAALANRLLAARGALERGRKARRTLPLTLALGVGLVVALACDPRWAI